MIHRTRQKTPFLLLMGVFLAGLPGFVAAQSGSPFPEIRPDSPEGRDIPEQVPTDLVEPMVSPRQTSADKVARLLNRNLRSIEEDQSLIIEELEALPQAARESLRPTAFGYHSGNAKQRPKWLQIDLGERAEPDAIALFPVTAEVDGKTVFGYGFPRSFRIDISDDAEFRNYETMVEGRAEDPGAARRWPYFKKLGGYSGRYIRVVATSMWRAGGPGNKDAFALSEVMVMKGGRNLAVNRPVKSLDNTERSNQWSRKFVCDGITTLGLPHGSTPSPTLGFRANSKKPTATSWVQIDLEESMPFQEIRVILADSPESIPDPTVRFPYPMKLEVSDSPDMRQAEPLGVFMPSQIGFIGNNPLTIPVAEGYGRYIRLTVTQPATKKRTAMAFELAELQVFSENRNVALGRPVSAIHPVKTALWSPDFLVDGYSSRQNLVSYQDWLGDLDRRYNLIREWLSLEEERLDLVDETLMWSLSSVGIGIAGVLGFVLIALSHGRIKRRKDLEGLRQRIASDLHDDIGSNLSSIALLAELGKTEVDEPELVVEELTDIKSTADSTIESMRDIVWLIRPEDESWKELLTRFRETASKLLRTHEYQFNVTGHLNDGRLPLEFKRDLFLIFKEVLNNIVKHAGARNVRIDVESKGNRFFMTIADDGVGFNNLDQEFREGNGLRNLRMRAQAIGGNLKMKSVINEGTTVQLSVKVP